MTFGSFSTTNANSTIASLGAQRSDWSEGFDRPMDTYSVQPTLTKIWGGHTARAGYDFRHQMWNITNDGLSGGRFQLQRRLHPGQQRAPRTNDRAQSWAQFLLGLPTAATGTVANAGGRISQFEIASPGEFSQISTASSCRTTGRSTPADAQCGPAARVQPGHARSRRTATWAARSTSSPPARSRRRRGPPTPPTRSRRFPPSAFQRHRRPDSSPTAR